MATLPADPSPHHRSLRTSSVRDDRRSLVDERRARPSGQDALLLLRAAVRHSAEGARTTRSSASSRGRNFPFNRGMLCPKGVKRYLQGSHPDRLVSALVRDTSSVVRIHVAAVCERRSRGSRRKSTAFSRRYGPSAVGVLGGASLTTEKTYLLGKFARMCLKTPYIDYNGRLCMVSAGAANKKAFGIDRDDQSVVGHDRHGHHLGRGIERRRVLAHHDELHLAGARAGRADHHAGSAHHAGRAHVRSVPAREARPRRRALCRRAAAHDRARLDRSRLHRGAHVGLRSGRRVLPAVDARASTAEVTGVPERAIRQAAEWWGTARPAFSFMRAASSITRTAWRTASAPSTSCWHRAASASRNAGTERLSARPTDKVGASMDRSAISCPAGATSAIPNTGGTSPASGAWTKPRCPAAGSTRTRCSARSTRVKSRACSRSASTRRCRCPTTRSSRVVSTSSSSTPRSISS